MSSFLRKRLSSPGIDHIPAVLIKAEGRTLIMRPINLLILFVINKNCLSSGGIRSLYLFMRWAIKQTVEIIEAYHFCCQGELHMQRKTVEIIVGFNAAGQLVTIKYSAFVRYRIKM